MPAKFKSTLSSQWLGLTDRQLDNSVAEIVTDIHKRSSMLAPEESGALVNSGRIERISTGFWRVIYGSTRVPYARIRHFQNKKNPQTLGYLERAGDSVARGNISKYLRK